MRPSSLFIIPTLALAIGLTGCNDTANRSDYPDRSAETKAEADAIRADGDRRQDAVEREREQQLTALGFDERQNAEKAALERERIALERDREVQPLKAKKAEHEANAKRECERIEREAETKLANTSGEEAARIKADAESRIAEVKRETTEKIAKIDPDIRAANQAAEDRIANSKRDEAKKQAEITAKRAEVENNAREQKLRIQSDVTTKLDRLGKTSAERRETVNEREAEAREADQRITSQVKKDLSRRGDQTSGVTVTTDNGVVMLGGTVRDDATRRTVVQETQRVSGVVRVEDRIAVH